MGRRMYAVIMAGGGGTRLHPLSRPERPKPFLPLLGDTSLLQATAARLDGVVDHVTVVTDRRYERLVREQLPDVDVLTEPMGRNTAAAIALATAAIDRPNDEVMLVLPADAYIDPAKVEVFRDVLRTAGDHLATGSFGIDDPLVTLGVQVTYPATEYGYLIPRLAARERDRRPRRLSAPGLRGEAEARPAPRSCSSETGVAWNAGMFLWRRRAIRGALERYTGLDPAHRADHPGPDPAPARLRAAQAGLDRLRGHGERGAQRQRGDGLDGRRLVRPRVVVGAARRDRGARDRGGGPARRDRRTSRSTTSSSVGSADASASSHRWGGVA